MRLIELVCHNVTQRIAVVDALLMMTLHQTGCYTIIRSSHCRCAHPVRTPVQDVRLWVRECASHLCSAKRLHHHGGGCKQALRLAAFKGVPKWPAGTQLSSLCQEVSHPALPAHTPLTVFCDHASKEAMMCGNTWPTGLAVVCAVFSGQLDSASLQRCQGVHNERDR